MVCNLHKLLLGLFVFLPLVLAQILPINEGCSSEGTCANRFVSGPVAADDADEDSGLSLLALSRESRLSTKANRTIFEDDPELRKILADAGEMQLEDARAYLAEYLPPAVSRLIGREGEDLKVYASRLEATARSEAKLKDWKFTCPTGPEKVHWTNFQGTFECDAEATVYCPSDPGEIAAAIQNHEDVRVTGLLHSWSPFACNKLTSKSTALISMKKFQALGPIDEDKQTVRVAAGVSTRDLMDYVGKHGYVLPSLPFWIDQTVAGAVATNTHGSSLSPGQTSMSVLAHSVSLVKADGTNHVFTKGRDDETLKVVAPSVGKLGVIHELEMSVVKDHCMEGRVQHWTESQWTDNFLASLKGPEGWKNIQLEAQTAWQMFWFPNLGLITGNQNELLGQNCKGAETGDYNKSPYDAMYSSMLAVAGFVRRMFPKTYEYFEVQMIENTMFCKGVCRASESQIVPTRIVGELAPLDIYDQYEFAIPIAKAETCFRQITETILKNPSSRKLFLAAPVLIRFVGSDDRLLSFANDGPVMLSNWNVNVAYRSHYAWECGVWESIVDLFESPVCSGRLHWGKTGWEHKTAVEAAEMYPKFTEFMKAKEVWDPQGKFVGGCPVFASNATDGFKAVCTGWKECQQPERQLSRCRCLMRGATCKWQNKF